MPSSKGRSPWKALVVAVVVCTFCFFLVAAGAVYWVVSLVNGHQPRMTRREHVPRDMVFRPEQVEPNTFTNNGVSTQPFENEKRAAGTEAPPARSKKDALKARTALTDPGAKPGEDLFRDLVIPQLRLEISTEAMVRLEVSPRTYVRATIREGDTVYTNVAIRLKGGPGSYKPLHDTPSFTVNFDQFAPGQTFHGLKKIHLNSSVQDNTRLNEKISRELFEAAGVPVPRAGHAILTINRRDPRLYVILEGVNKQFLKRYFKDAKGNVYDGHSGTDVNQSLPVNSGEEPLDRLRDLAQAAREPDLKKRLEKLEQTLDLDRFISFMALEMILSHWDGYTIGRNNYRIAHDRDTDRMVFIPHGMDQVLGGARQPLLSPAPAGLVARAVLQIPEERQRYRDRVAELSTNVFKVAALTNRVWEIARSIASALEESDSQAAASYRDRIAPAYCRKIQQRAASLQREINPTAPSSSVKFDRYAAAPLTNWSMKIDVGTPELRQEKDERGQTLLYIGTSAESTSSWRTSVVLDRGRYRLEANIKTRGVVLEPTDKRAGAGLRVSRYRDGQRNSGDRDWTPIAFEFDVEQDGMEKELVCELRANKGEIWYELNSLRLKRL